MTSFDNKNIISIQNINVVFNKDTVNETYALQDFSLDVKYGDLIFIRGENGSGKSTLLNVIKKDIRNFDGNIYIKGINIQNINDYKISKFTQFIYQNPLQGLCPNLTVYENLFYSIKKNKKLKLNYAYKKQYKKYIQSLLLELGLNVISEKLNETVINLSGGEKQLVSIAKIPLESPDILLLDEPTASLDKKNKEIVEESLMKLINKNKITTLWITHNIPISNEFKNIFLKNNRYEIK